MHDRKFAKKGAQSRAFDKEVATERRVADASSLLTAAYFENAVEAVERRIRGYRESLVTSDAWLPRFKVRIYGYYEIRSNGN